VHSSNSAARSALGRRRVADRHRAGGRRAGAVAVRTELKNWTKGASSPVSEADIAVNDLLEKRLRKGDARLRLAVGGKRR